MPDVIEAGSEITVNVTVNKGKVAEFAQFRQDLPYGFSAMAVNSANANFSFQDQIVRLTWLRLPDDDEIVFTYKIVANERLTGRVDLSGRFTYIDNNERKTVEQQPRLLAITPSSNVNPAMLVDVNDYAKIASIEAIAKAGKTVAFRQQPTWVEDDRIFLVTLLVNKDQVQKFAKIEETVPAGYTAASIDSRGGIFTYKDQMAKFIWMDLPAEPFFTVMYKLIPEEGTVIDQQAMRIAGEFSYMVNDRTFSSVIIERRETLARLNRDQVNDLLRDVAVQVTEQQPVLVAGTTTQQQPVSGTTTTPPATTTRPPSTTTSTPTSTPRPISTPAIATSSDASDMLKPESGVYYRVQIAAGHRPVNTQRYFRNYRLEYSVMREDHEGWYKYSVGSFAEYKDARDYRVHLGNTTTINDAFIAAYNNGKRITVQDALMALNQRWVK